MSGGGEGGPGCGDDDEQSCDWVLHTLCDSDGTGWSWFLSERQGSAGQDSSSQQRRPKKIEPRQETFLIRDAFNARDLVQRFLWLAGFGPTTVRAGDKPERQRGKNDHQRNKLKNTSDGHGSIEIEQQYR